MGIHRCFIAIPFFSNNYYVQLKKSGVFSLIFAQIDLIEYFDVLAIQLYTHTLNYATKITSMMASASGFQFDCYPAKHFLQVSYHYFSKLRKYHERESIKRIRMHNTYNLTYGMNIHFRTLYSSTNHSSLTIQISFIF